MGRMAAGFGGCGRGVCRRGSSGCHRASSGGLSAMADVFADALKHLDEAFRYASLHEEALERLRRPKLVMEVSIPVRMDDGSCGSSGATGCRLDDTRGPGKGGVRYHPRRRSVRGQGVGDVDDLQVRGDGSALRRGQGRGDRRSEGALPARTGTAEPRLRAGLRRLDRPGHRYSGAGRLYQPDDDGLDDGRVLQDPPQAHAGGGHREADSARAAAPGATRRRGGAPTSASRSWRRSAGGNRAEITVAVQGFGNAGQAVARLLHADGYRIVAVSDSRGGMHAPTGSTSRA